MTAHLLQLRQAKTEIVSASKVAYRFLLGATSNSSPSADSPGSSGRGSPRFQAAWFKNLVTTGAKPSASPEVENLDDRDTKLLPRRKDDESPLRQCSRPDT